MLCYRITADYDDLDEVQDDINLFEALSHRQVGHAAILRQAKKIKDDRDKAASLLLETVRL